MNNTPSNTNNTTRFRTFVIRQQEAQVFGTEAASVLSQIRYWTDPSRSKNYKEGRYWVYNSLSDWHQQFATISQRTLRRIFESLEKMGVLIAKKYNAWRRDQRKWHSVDFEKLAEILRTFPVKSSKRKRGKDPDPDQNNETSQGDTIEEKESTQTEEKPEDVSGSDIKNGGNLDVANLAHCTVGQSGHMNTEKSLEMISLPYPLKSENSDPLREMIYIWNEKVEHQTDKVSLSFWHRKALNKAFQQHFQSSLDEWKKYCLTIAYNSFLMGGGPNKWKASLDWALKPHNIQKVKEKSYSGQEEIPEPTKPFDRDSLKGNDTWKDIAEILFKSVGDITFQNWFEKAHISQEGTNRPVIHLGTPFMASFVKSHYSQFVEASVRAVLPHMKYLDYQA